MNGYLRKAQHDENNLNIEVTVEVISDFKVKKASVFNGFKRQTTKSTASRPPAALPSSPSAYWRFKLVQRCSKAPKNCGFSGLFLSGFFRGCEGDLLIRAVLLFYRQDTAGYW